MVPWRQVVSTSKGCKVVSEKKEANEHRARKVSQSGKVLKSLRQKNIKEKTKVDLLGKNNGVAIDKNFNKNSQRVVSIFKIQDSPKHAHVF